MLNKKKFLPVRRAVQDRGFLYPDFKNSVRKFLILIGRFYLKYVEGLSKVSFINEERIIEAMHKFSNKEERLIFVFRHAAKEDPPLLMYSFLNPLRKKIERNGGISHLRVLYGRDVPNWAGPITEWLFPKIGAVPVQAHNGNKEALSILRKEMKDGPFPLALAPEEQVVYHMYNCFDIAQGISSLVNWGLDSGKPVRIVPLGMGYRYGNNPEKFIKEKLFEWEKKTGIILEKEEKGKLHPLLCQAAEKTISLLEPLCGILPPENKNTSSPEEIEKRIRKLCKTLLTEAEKEAKIIKQGSDSDRLFKIRYSGHEAFYTEENPTLCPSFKRALLDFSALKAEVYIRYERIVDVLEYIHMSYITPPFSAGRGCEFILNLLDVINRASGGEISERSTPSGTEAVLIAGEPIIYSDNSKKGLGRRDFIEKVRTDVKESFIKTSKELEQKWEIVKLE
ncbi:MAG: hypothetical protein PQJ46_00170 [Spirochaetales bacterium]|nr:hypothetical protein [Spirochaetales bacterium]